MRNKNFIENFDSLPKYGVNFPRNSLPNLQFDSTLYPLKLSEFFPTAKLIRACCIFISTPKYKNFNLISFSNCDKVMPYNKRDCSINFYTIFRY